MVGAEGFEAKKPLRTGADEPPYQKQAAEFDVGFDFGGVGPARAQC